MLVHKEVAMTNWWDGQDNVSKAAETDVHCSARSVDDKDKM